HASLPHQCPWPRRPTIPGPATKTGNSGPADTNSVRIITVSRLTGGNQLVGAAKGPQNQAPILLIRQSGREDAAKARRIWGGRGGRSAQSGRGSRSGGSFLMLSR